ncbi:MAG TPA: hypothetical protein IAA42_05175 [Candidatus Olsenella excrementavium]|uniref:Restriction endonuclease n=1 Tax=Candidatus Olsenella excrementavium TaxID=2838709 RepID=A0A9D1ZBJ6_9ACTN|nr:hypothetical protein [Candidatus Olsenella excrementavium]
MEIDLAAKAIETTQSGFEAYFKFLSANDSGATGAHQSGILLSNRAMPMIFGDRPTEHVAKRENMRITWQDDVVTYSTFTWYESKGELRLTRLGRGFPYLNPDFTGALFVFTRVAEGEYEAFLLNSEDEIDRYLAAFSLGPQDAGQMFDPLAGPKSHEDAEEAAIRAFVRYLGIGANSDFPLSETISGKAREIQNAVHDRRDLIVENPDLKVIEYTRVEYAIFREIEAQMYGPIISRGFDTVEQFVSVANTVLNRRKSRAGKSLEHHLASIFHDNSLPFEEQVVTEGNKKPDFVFPSGAAYHDPSYSADKLVVLAAKTTCKDRWRQIITEADRMRGRTHFLMTLQQGNTPRQLEEMRAANVKLVVPKPYIKAYPPEFQDDIWPLKQFIEYAKETVCSL